MSVSLDNKQWGIVGLTAVTALIHLIFGILNLPDPIFGILFVLNGLGYIALVAALYFIPQLAAQKEMVRWAFIGFTALTVILYFVFNLPDVDAFGLFDKAVEVALIVLLWLDR